MGVTEAMAVMVDMEEDGVGAAGAMEVTEDMGTTVSLWVLLLYDHGLLLFYSLFIQKLLKLTGIKTYK